MLCIPIGSLTHYMVSTPQLSHGHISEVAGLNSSLQGSSFSAGALVQEECLVVVVVTGLWSSQCKSWELAHH